MSKNLSAIYYQEKTRKITIKAHEIFHGLLL